MSYKLDQDTDIECRDEWAELDEYDFDSTPPLHSSSAHDYDPDEPYDTWNGYPDEIGEDMYSQQQLEQTVHPKQNYHSDQNRLTNNNIIDLPNQINPVNPISSIYEKIDNRLDLSNKEKTNRKIKYQNIVDFFPELKARGFGQYAKDINHYTTEIIWPKYQIYGVIVDEPTYNKYLYHVSYRRRENSSRPSGYETVMLGFVHKSQLEYYPPDNISNKPSYRVEIKDLQEDIYYIHDSLRFDEWVRQTF